MKLVFNFWWLSFIGAKEDDDVGDKAAKPARRQNQLSHFLAGVL